MTFVYMLRETIFLSFQKLYEDQKQMNFAWSSMKSLPGQYSMEPKCWLGRQRWVESSRWKGQCVERPGGEYVLGVL